MKDSEKTLSSCTATEADMPISACCSEKDIDSGEAISPVRVAMIGIGHAHAPGVMQELLKHKDWFTVVGYVPFPMAKDQYSPSEIAKIEARKAEDPFKALTELSDDQFFAANDAIQVDAFFVESTANTLLQAAHKYIALGKAMHVDKSAVDKGSCTLSGLLDIAEGKGIPIQLGYMYRYNPAVRECRKYIRDGRMGEVYEIDACMNTELPQSDRRGLGAYPGGAMYVYGCHLIDLAVTIMGLPSQTYKIFRETGFDGVTDARNPIYDDTMVILAYKKGTAIIKATAVEANGYGRRQFVVCGSKGTVEIKPLEPLKKEKASDPDSSAMYMTYAKRDGKNVYQNKASKVDLSAYTIAGRYYDMLFDFVRLVRGAPDSELIFPVNYEYERALDRLIRALSGSVNTPKEI